MNKPMLNTLGRIILLITINLSLLACGNGNNAPVASDAVVSLLPGETVTGTLVAKDADGGSLTISLVTDASNGTLTLDDATTGAYTYTHDGSINGDNFTFWANDGLLDSNIATVTVIVATTAPDAPASGLLATPGDQRVTLNWDAVEGADSYNVYLSDTPGTGTAGSKITDVMPPYYHDGLSNGLNYYYVVTAVNALGESAASLEVNATPVDILLSSLSFPDAGLQACIVISGEIYVHDLTAVKNLPDCNPINSGNYIADLTGIEALTSLTSLTLNSGSYSDLSLLSGLTGLTYLSISEANISDLSPLAGLTDLAYLEISYNNISDVSPLAGMSNLTTLIIGSNSISDVSPLAGLTNLTSLSLDGNSIGGQGVGNVDALVTLTSATNIYLYDNISMSCGELETLIAALGAAVKPGTADPGVNCTNP